MDAFRVEIPDQAVHDLAERLRAVRNCVSVAVRSDAAGNLRQWLLAAAAGFTEGVWLAGSGAGRDGAVGDRGGRCLGLTGFG